MCQGIIFLLFRDIYVDLLLLLFVKMSSFRLCLQGECNVDIKRITSPGVGPASYYKTTEILFHTNLDR